MSKLNVDLFTKQEHVVIADWLRVEPRCDGDDLPSPSAALEQPGLPGRSSSRSANDDAVVLLAAILHRQLL